MSTRVAVWDAATLKRFTERERHVEKARLLVLSSNRGLAGGYNGNVLLTGGKFYPPLDVKAEEIISWTEEAEARMERVPIQVKGVARTALLPRRLAHDDTGVERELNRVPDPQAARLEDPISDEPEVRALELCMQGERDPLDER